MKYLFFLIFLVAINLANDKIKCNRELLESYDLEGSDYVVKDTNFLCTNVKQNCCNYKSQV